MTETPVLLTVQGLCKSYAAPVLTEIDFDLRPGEVHALVGENGAGKSTLSRILAGLTRPNRGRMTLSGQPYAPRTKRAAERRGVRMVMQELNLIGNLTVAESIFIGQWPHRLGWMDYPRLEIQARQLLIQVGLAAVNPRAFVKSLGVGQQQLVEIAAGLSRRCHLLILDEPTAALTDPEIERLFEQITRLKAEGTSILYISHRMEEIRRISDRVTILRDGRRVATHPARELQLDTMVRLMVGREIDDTPPRRASKRGPLALQVRSLQRKPSLKEVSFDVHRGEILGFAGLMGSGRTETLRAVFGADRPDTGEIRLYNQPRPVRLRSPRQAVRHGLALLTEDRKSQGLLLPLPIRPNVTLASLPRMNRWSWIRRRQEISVSKDWVRRLSLHCSGIEQTAEELSGGNQQKVVMAKWLLRNCEILLFDEPTRGIDVGARYEIYQLLNRLAEEGKAIVVVSSDLRELLGLCDRIAVMSAGRLVKTFARDDWSLDQIMKAALCGY